MDRQVFFDQIRPALFGGELTSQQVEGIECILDEWEHQWNDTGTWYESSVMIAQLAYVLATPYLETGRKMWPVREYGGDDYLHAMYDPDGDRPHVAERLGNTKPGDGIRFAGDGMVQLTGRRNYEFQGKKLGIDLLTHPELVRQPDVSARILVRGMLDGDFTGVSLDDCINAGKIDFFAARAIINGRDKARKIAGYAKKFQSAIQSGVTAAVNAEKAKRREAVEARVQDMNYQPLEPELQKEQDVVKRREPEKPKQPGKVESVRRNLSGWKTHIGMFISAVLGILAMFGVLPGVSPDTGASMFQNAALGSGFRSAIPKFITLAIQFYIEYVQGNSVKTTTARKSNGIF